MPFQPSLARRLDLDSPLPPARAAHATAPRFGERAAAASFPGRLVFRRRSDPR